MLDVRDRHEFNDIVETVKTAFGCPVAVLSILDEQRQVFVAHMGLPARWAESGETPLTHSFCRHVVDDRKPLVITDATVHELVRDNLAIPDLGVISYLGVPVILPGGMIIGALAAIDSSPREWTDEQLALLLKFGKLASNQIATFLAERRWTDIFEQLDQAFVVGTVLREADGHTSNWRIDSANSAWGGLLGLSDQDFAGTTILDLLPGLERVH